MGSQLINNGQGVMLRQQMDQRLQMKKNGLGDKLGMFGGQQSGSYSVRGQGNAPGAGPASAQRGGPGIGGSLGKFGKGPFGSDQMAGGNSLSVGGLDRVPQRNNYGGIGRMVLFDEDAPIHRADRKKKRFHFDPSEGRDYAADAPQDERQGRIYGSAQSQRSKQSAKGGEAAFNIPAIKSPAQVAAEKAAEQKRMQLEAEANRKNKSYITKKPAGASQAANQAGLFDMSSLETQLAQLAEAQNQ